MPTTLAWVGDGAPRMEVAHVERSEQGLAAAGTQLGAAYELRYRLEPEVLSLELIGRRSLDVELGDADYFDLGFSPLFNSLPVIGDRLLERGQERSYRMRWVEVPSLAISISKQRYEPIGNRCVRFTAGSFSAEIEFDEDGFVVAYPGIAKRPR